MTELTPMKGYSYSLPEDKIAKYPVRPRDRSKLLVYRNGKITDEKFAELANHIPVNSMLIFNDSRVLPTRLLFTTEKGAQVEIFCLMPEPSQSYANALGATGICTWRCMIGNLKKWKDGLQPLYFVHCSIRCKLNVYLMCRDERSATVQFQWTEGICTFADVLQCCGSIPLPPYLNRSAEADDAVNYQTIYSRNVGSSAAPTAGLHFTEDVLRSLTDVGIKSDSVTLHVSAGTFLPVKNIYAENHIMQCEYIEVSTDLIRRLCKHEGKVIAVGTTSLRTLESIYHLACALIKTGTLPVELGQWDAYNNDDSITTVEALTALADHLEKRGQKTLTASTCLMIMPPYRIRMADGILTNFHQPKSTLLLLVAAIAGDAWHEIYEHALDSDYRFLSYGDTTLMVAERT